jgi:TetR/AcrR family acrAB operon transcriptional repressor
MARRTKAEAAETRQRILDEALDLFSTNGYARTTFEDVARKIGLSKGAVYWHFKTKTDLLVALIEHGCNRKGLCLGAPEESADTRAALRHGYVDSARVVLAEPDLRRFEFFIHFQIEWSEQLLAEVRTKLASLREDPVLAYTKAIRRLQENGEVAPAVDAERLASLLTANWTGLLRLALIGLIDPNDFPERAGYSFDLMFNDRAT